MTDVRRLFDETLPSFFETNGGSEGFRCRFHVRGAGAWEVDLRVLGGCVDAHHAPGGYHAVVELAADDWARADVKTLVEQGRVKTSLTDHANPGDDERAREMLAALFRAPPIVWPASLRIEPVASAFLRATADIVDEDVGDIVSSRKASKRTLVPPLPFLQSVLGGGQPQWWYEDLIELHDALVGSRDAGDGDPLDARFPEEHGGDIVTVRRISPDVHAAIALATNETWRALAEKLMPHVVRPYERGLRRLGAFAREAQANDEALWFWGRYE